MYDRLNDCTYEQISDEVYFKIDHDGDTLYTLRVILMDMLEEENED